MNRKVIVYIATSLDGYIAKPNDDLSFLSLVEQEGEDYGYGEFYGSVDTVIVGRKTYDKVVSMGIESPYSDKKAYVITRIPRSAIGSLTFYTQPLRGLVEKLKSTPGKNIYCDGGAQIVNELLRHNLVDEVILSVIPVFVGSGTRLFTDGRPEQKMRLVSVRSFEKGLVQLRYQCVHDEID